MFGFTSKKPYYFGDGRKHVLMLRPSEVKAYFQVNEAASKYTWQELVTGVYLDVDEKDWKRYNSICKVINRYVKSHTVYYKDESQPVLRPVK